MDIASLLNEDKNIRINKTNHRKIENQINLFYHHMKKIEIYQTKTFTVIIAQENHFQTATIIIDNNNLSETLFTLRSPDKIITHFFAK